MADTTLRIRFTEFLSTLSRLGDRVWAMLRRFTQELSVKLQPFRQYYIPIDLKFALAIAVVIGASMSLLGYTILRNQNTLLNEQIRRMGRTVTGQLAANALEPMLASDQLRLDLLVRDLGREPAVVGAGLFDSRSVPLSMQGAIPAPALWEHEEADGQTASGEQEASIHDFEWSVMSLEDEAPLQAVTYLREIRFQGLLIGHAAVTFSRELLDIALTRSRGAIYTATLVMVLFGLALSVFVGRRLSRPIHELMDASKAIGEGDLKYRFKGRRNDEVGRLMSSFNEMAEGLLAKSQVEDAFRKYVPEQVAKKLLADLREVKLGGQRAWGTVVFADIAGFTAISEGLEPDAVAQLINDYFSYTAKATTCYQGSVDKYIGDEAMLVFGVPDPDPDHCFHAIATAVLLRELTERVNKRRAEEGKAVVRFKIGINTGQMLAGNMGSMEHMQFTVVGDSVNLASRLCGMAEAGQIIISKNIYERPDVRAAIEAKRHVSMKLRGKRLPVMTYLVTDLVPYHRRKMEEHLEEILAGSEDDGARAPTAEGAEAAGEGQEEGEAGE